MEKPSKNDQYTAPYGEPVAAPVPGQNAYYGQQQQQQQPYYNQQPQVDQYGRPIVDAVPVQQPQVLRNNDNIRRDMQGNALCNKCSAPYPLPPGTTSWRCRNCHTLNNASIYGDECCIIL